MNQYAVYQIYPMGLTKTLYNNVSTKVLISFVLYKVTRSISFLYAGFGDMMNFFSFQKFN